MHSQPEEALRMVQDGAMPVAAAVNWSGVGRSKLYQAMARGDLSFVKDGKRRLIPRKALQDYLAKRLVCDAPIE